MAKILLMDDDIDFSSGLSLGLRSAGHDVTTSRSASEAREA